MARATVVLREKVIDEAGDILELVIWRVPVNVQYPERIRYRLAYIRRGERMPAVLYDNHAPKGHHRHVQGVAERYRFTGVDRLLADFRADIARVKGGRSRGQDTDDSDQTHG